MPWCVFRECVFAGAQVCGLRGHVGLPVCKDAGCFCVACACLHAHVCVDVCGQVCMLVCRDLVCWWVAWVCVCTRMGVCVCVCGHRVCLYVFVCVFPYMHMCVFVPSVRACVCFPELCVCVCV